MAKNKLFFLAWIISCLALASTVTARDFEKYANKTFHASRPTAINTAMEYTLWHEHAYNKHQPRIHTHIQAAPFYQYFRLRSI